MRERGRPRVTPINHPRQPRGRPRVTPIDHRRMITRRIVAIGWSSRQFGRLYLAFARGNEWPHLDSGPTSKPKCNGSTSNDSLQFRG
jgi:hypothetical protein